MTIEFTVPGLRIESEMNRREHWAARAKRFKSQRLAVYLALSHELRKLGLNLPYEGVKTPLVITLTRIAPRAITDEHENLRCGFKAVVDQVAMCLGFDDGDKELTWEYAQQKGAPKTYGIAVRIESA